MVSVVAFQRVTNIVANHIANCLHAMRLFQQVAGNRSGGNRGYMLMLADGLNLLLRQTAEGDAILKLSLIHI